MPARSLPRRRPIPTAATVAFLAALAATAAYAAGLVPGVPKTLPTFSRLVAVTVGAFLLAATAWTVSVLAG